MTSQELNKKRDEMAEIYVYNHCRRIEGTEVKQGAFKAGFDAAVQLMQEERKDKELPLACAPDEA